MGILRVQRSLLLREAQLLKDAAEKLERQIQTATLVGGSGAGVVPHIENARQFHPVIGRIEDSLGQLKTLTRHWSK